MIKSRLLTNKITIFFLILTSIYFLINITLTIIYINDEKRQDLEILLWHSINESYDYVKKYNDKTDLAFLYDIPHMTSVLEKSGAREILFFYCRCGTSINGQRRWTQVLEQTKAAVKNGRE